MPDVSRGPAPKMVKKGVAETGCRLNAFLRALLKRRLVVVPIPNLLYDSRQRLRTTNFNLIFPDLLNRIRTLGMESPK